MKIDDINTTNKRDMTNQSLAQTNIPSSRRYKKTDKSDMNKSKEKENKVINKNSTSKEKDNKVIVLNKGKDNKLINMNNKNRGKENNPNQIKKEPMIIQKNGTMTNKIVLNKNIKEVKKGNKSPNPGNGVIKKKIVVANPKQKQGNVIKISPGKNPKEKINSAKVRMNTDNTNSEIKKPITKQGQRPIKNITNRKSEKSPNSNSNKK